MTKITSKRASEDDSFELPFRSPQVLSKTYSSTVLEIFLDSEITSPDKYREVYHALSNAGAQDIVCIHINSPGGRLDAGVQIINHIKNCKAKTIGILHMECASMASGIALACDEWELNTFSTMMVHSCSYGAVGKQSDVHTRVDFTTKFNEDFIREIYTGFLTESEISRVLDGADLYFNFDKLKNKLESFQDYREVKRLEEEENLLKEAEKKLKDKLDSVKPKTTTKKPVVKRATTSKAKEKRA